MVRVRRTVGKDQIPAESRTDLALVYGKNPKHTMRKNITESRLTANVVNLEKQARKRDFQPALRALWGVNNIKIGRMRGMGR